MGKSAFVFLLLTLWTGSAESADMVVNRQLLGEPESLDPHLISGSTDFDVVEDLFEGLTTQASDGSTIPGLADHWDISSDRLHWVFHLRPGLTWSDGSTLGADDFVWALRRAVAPATISPYASSLLPIKDAGNIIAGNAEAASLGVSAPDEKTVVVDLVEPTPFLADLVSLPVAYPLPRAAIERWGKDWARPGHLISDGAFILDAWTPQADIRLARNSRYHDAASVKLDHVDWILAEDRKAGLRRFRAGELDSALLAAEDYNWASKKFADALRSVPLLATQYLVVNMARDGLPARDNRVREALSLAIDRDLLVQKIDTRGQLAAWGLVPPGMRNYRTVPAPTLSTADRHAKARSLWDAVQKEQPAPITIILMVEKDDTDHRIAGALRAMWQETLGAKIVLEEQEWQIYQSRRRQGNFEIAMVKWYADFADPWTFLANFRTDAGPLNDGAYHSVAYDTALDAAKRSDGAARLVLLENAEAQLLTDYAVIPLEFMVSQKLVNPHITGWQADAFDMNLSRYLGLK